MHIVLHFPFVGSSTSPLLSSVSPKNLFPLYLFLLSYLYQLFFLPLTSCPSLFLVILAFFYYVAFSSLASSLVFFIFFPSCDLWVFSHQWQAVCPFIWGVGFKTRCCPSSSLYVFVSFVSLSHLCATWRCWMLPGCPFIFTVFIQVTHMSLTVGYLTQNPSSLYIVAITQLYWLWIGNIIHFSSHSAPLTHQPCQPVIWIWFTRFREVQPLTFPYDPQR